MSEIGGRIASLSPEKRALLERRMLAKAAGAPPAIPRRQPGDPAPLSFAQQRVWFLDQLDPGNAAYNIYRAVRLTGLLDAGALTLALTEIVRRHETLRSRFPEVNGAPKLIVDPPAAAALPIEDLSALPPERAQAEAARLAALEASRPFHLARERALRLRLLRLGAEQHVLLLTTHHIAADGWSVGILFREIAALYAAFREDRPSPLPELPIQYSDYALWQRRRLTSERLDELTRYWRRQLGGAAYRLELPADKPRPARLSPRGGRHFLFIPAAALDALKRLGRSENTTLFMTLLAGFNALLARYTGSEDILVGSPVGGREQPELEGLIGCFSNTLVLRTSLAGGVTFRQLLTRVRETALNAFAHQDLPFEKLVETLSPPRDPSRMTLVQVNFRLLTAPLPPLRAADLKLEFLEVDNEGSKFDLAFELYEKPDGLGGFIEYSADLYRPETLPLIASDFQDVLQACAAQPDVSLNAIETPLRLGSAGPSRLRTAARKGVYLPPRYALRTATVKDSAFLYDLRRQTMQDVVSRTEGWTDEYREAYFMDFDPAAHQIIAVNGREVGALAAVEEQDEVYFANLHLLPEAQGMGLGSSIMRDVIARAHAKGLPVKAQVLKANSASLRMCERVGMSICGETEQRFLLTSALKGAARGAV